MSSSQGMDENFANYPHAFIIIEFQDGQAALYHKRSFLLKNPLKPSDKYRSTIFEIQFRNLLIDRTSSVIEVFPNLHFKGFERASLCFLHLAAWHNKILIESTICSAGEEVTRKNKTFFLEDYSQESLNKVIKKLMPVLKKKLFSIMGPNPINPEALIVEQAAQRAQKATETTDKE